MCTNLNSKMRMMKNMPVYLSVLTCSKQSIRRNRQMTGPFMSVGTEDSIHDCAVVMRRTANVSAYEYDIVLCVPRSERLHSIGCDA